MGKPKGAYKGRKLRKPQPTADPAPPAISRPPLAAVPGKAEWRLMGMGERTLAIATLVFFVLLMLVANATLKPQLDNPEYVTVEGKLVKGAPLGIAPGERYTYVYTVDGNTSVNLTYSVFQGSGCTMVSFEQGHASACLDDAGNDPTGQNTTYANQEIILMRPWMLAVGEGWSWNVSSFILYQGFVKRVSDTSYSFARKERYKGREAYVVRITSSANATIWDWVDSEKRMLLREIGPGYELELFEGLQPG